MKFKEHQVAHHLLDGLEGIEIGGSAHNAFGLKTRNVDYSGDMNTIFKQAEIQFCGEAMPVDIIAPGDRIPLADQSVDFIISSHVIEHFWDPIQTLKEWMRVARRYVFIIAPLPDALPSDQNRPLTSLQEFRDRHDGTRPAPMIDTHEHYSVWTCDTFCAMCRMFIGEQGFHISHSEAIDTKVGNGFTVVVQRPPRLSLNPISRLARWAKAKSSGSLPSFPDRW